MFLKYISLFVVLIQITSSDVPSSFKICPKSQGNREECIKKALQELAPVLKSGNISPTIKLSPSIDPFLLGDFVVDAGVKMKVIKYTAYGSSNYVVEKVAIPSLGKIIKMSAIIRFPKLKAESGYEMNWKIGPVDIKGKGKSYAAFEDLRINYLLNGIRETRNGKEYIKLTNVKVKSQVNGLKLRFDNLFNGNKQLEDAANELINQNTQIVIQATQPKMEIAFGEIGLKMGNQIFSKIPADLLFPD